MQIVKWDPASSSYIRYGSGPFPACSPGDAFWIKPSSIYPATYPAAAITPVEVSDGLLTFADPQVPPDYTENYRLIKVFVNDYTKDSRPESSCRAPYR